MITVVALASLAYPHEYTFADMRAMPEASLRYPRAAVVQVSGNGYVEGGFDAPATPPEVDTTFKVAVSTGQVLDGYRLLDWYRRQLTAMGWQYAGCVSTARPPNNAVVPGWYFFGRHPDEVFSISFDAGTGTYETRLDLQTTVSASSKVAAGSFGGCQGLLF